MAQLMQKYAELRAEVDALRDMLEHPDAHPAQLEERISKSGFVLRNTKYRLE